MPKYLQGLQRKRPLLGLYCDCGDTNQCPALGTRKNHTAAWEISLAAGARDLDTRNCASTLCDESVKQMYTACFGGAVERLQWEAEKKGSLKTEALGHFEDG